MRASYVITIIILAENEFKRSLKLNSRKEDFSIDDRVTGDDCLLSFALWCDSPHVFMHMHNATVSLKSRLNKWVLWSKGNNFMQSFRELYSVVI